MYSRIGKYAACHIRCQMAIKREIRIQFEMIFLKESQDFVKSGQNMAGIFLEKIL